MSKRRRVDTEEDKISEPLLSSGFNVQEEALKAWKAYLSSLLFSDADATDEKERKSIGQLKIYSVVSLCAEPLSQMRARLSCDHFVAEGYSSMCKSCPECRHEGKEEEIFQPGATAKFLEILKVNLGSVAKDFAILVLMLGVAAQALSRQDAKKRAQTAVTLFNTVRKSVSFLSPSQLSTDQAVLLYLRILTALRDDITNAEIGVYLGMLIGVSDDRKREPVAGDPVLEKFLTFMNRKDVQTQVMESFKTTSRIYKAIDTKAFESQSILNRNSWVIFSSRTLADQYGAEVARFAPAIGAHAMQDYRQQQRKTHEKLLLALPDLSGIVTREPALEVEAGSSDDEESSPILVPPETQAQVLAADEAAARGLAEAEERTAARQQAADAAFARALANPAAVVPAPQPVPAVDIDPFVAAVSAITAASSDDLDRAVALSLQESQIPVSPEVNEELDRALALSLEETLPVFDVGALQAPRTSFDFTRRS